MFVCLLVSWLVGNVLWRVALEVVGGVFSWLVGWLPVRLFCLVDLFACLFVCFVFGWLFACLCVLFGWLFIGWLVGWLVGWLEILKSNSCQTI